MKSRLEECLEYFVLDHEGRVNEDVPGDPGGKTHWGITQSDYDQYRSKHGLPHSDVFIMTKAEVYAVYMEHYWVPMNCDNLPKPLDLVVFDTAINMSNHRARHFLNATQGISDPVRRSSDFIQQREDAYEALVGTHRGLRKFLKGWLRRCEDLRGHL